MCTSIAWNTENFGTITTRTNDWMEATHPQLGGIPSGTQRFIQGAGNGLKYTTKYDIVGVIAYGDLDLVHDAVNSEGLQVNALFYRPMTMEPVTKDSQITQFTLGEYFLANYSTVEEILRELPNLELGSLKLEAMPLDITLHWSVTDRSGDRAIIELDPDGIDVYRGDEAAVMTNAPSMKDHLADLKKVKPIWVSADRDLDFGSNGNSNARSRFIHASYFKQWLKQPSSTVNAMMKLSTVTYRVPQDAPYIDFGKGMTGYGTEWSMTQSLTTGDSVFQYNFDDHWSTVSFNVYELMGKNFRTPLDKTQLSTFSVEP
ncbi:linear amide C-N hydrolase [Paraferrimonas sedimenticola]|uniref:Choloylglycine hydrolase n=1 Tax=Paraferrimonas sedimenticola TaxID=375674 RepID=A0AA37W097_9GAMM|nr:linear amide C-N hydrolase [Paraferrimonas sedimenticola]GLP96115.1 choloylglycine hydrolase [Paraferrimonas sedimenticola]